MRIVVIFLLCIVGLVGLGMSLCGGAITLSSLGEHGHGGEFPASGFLVISVPSLVIGLALVIVAVRSLRRHLSALPEPREQSSDHPG